MRWFKNSFAVCSQNLRKISDDSRVYIALILLFIVHGYKAFDYYAFSSEIGNVGITPWMYIFTITGWEDFKMLTLFPLVLLFCNAPFIDHNQPFVISRCTRTSWCFGQLIYTFIVSTIYTVVDVGISILLILGRVDWTLDWGVLMRTAVEGLGTGKYNYLGGTGANAEIINNYTPSEAMIYSVLMTWLACIFLGLLIYVINSATQKTIYGSATAVFFIIWDAIWHIVASSTGYMKYNWFCRISPVSWCSIDLMYHPQNTDLPSFAYGFYGYLILIIALSAIALLISRKQQIEVTDAV